MVPDCLAGVVPEVLAAGVLGVSTITSVSNVLAFFFFLFLNGEYRWVANDAVICSSSSASPDDDSDSVSDFLLCGVFCPNGKDSSPDDLFSSFSALFSVAVLVVFGFSGWVSSVSGWNSTVVICSPSSTVDGMGGACSLTFIFPAGSRDAYVGGELDLVFLSEWLHCEQMGMRCCLASAVSSLIFSLSSFLRQKGQTCTAQISQLILFERGSAAASILSAGTSSSYIFLQCRHSWACAFVLCA